MTFDDAIENINVLSSFSTVYGISPTVVLEIISKLKEEYAPTVEITNEKAETLKSMVKLVGDEFTQDELPEDGSVKITDKMFEPQDDFILLKDLNLILHQDSIKIING